MSLGALAELGDHLTVLEAAIEDVQHDLGLEPGREDYESAFRHLFEAAEGLRGHRLRARAVAGAG